MPAGVQLRGVPEGDGPRDTPGRPAISAFEPGTFVQRKLSFTTSTGVDPAGSHGGLAIDRGTAAARPGGAVAPAYILTRTMADRSANA